MNVPSGPRPLPGRRPFPYAAQPPASTAASSNVAPAPTMSLPPAPHTAGMPTAHTMPSGMQRPTTTTPLSAYPALPPPARTTTTGFLAPAPLLSMGLRAPPLSGAAPPTSATVPLPPATTARTTLTAPRPPVATTAPQHNATWALQHFAPFRESQDLATLATPTPSPAPPPPSLQPAASPAIAAATAEELRALRDERARLSSALHASEQRLEELSRAARSAQQELVRVGEENAALRRGAEERAHATPAIKEFYERELQEERRRKSDVEDQQTRLHQQLQDAQQQLRQAQQQQQERDKVSKSPGSADAQSMEPPPKRARLNDAPTPSSTSHFESALGRERLRGIVARGGVVAAASLSEVSRLDVDVDVHHVHVDVGVDAGVRELTRLLCAARASSPPALWAHLFARLVRVRAASTLRFASLLARFPAALVALKAALPLADVDVAAKRVVLVLVRCLTAPDADEVRHALHCLAALAPLPRAASLFSRTELSELLAGVVAAVRALTAPSAPAHAASLCEFVVDVLADGATLLEFLHAYSVSALLALPSDDAGPPSCAALAAAPPLVAPAECAFEPVRVVASAAALWEQQLLWLRVLLLLSERLGPASSLASALLASRLTSLPELISRLVLLLHATLDAADASAAPPRLLRDLIHAGVALIALLVASHAAEAQLPQAVRHPLLGFLARLLASEAWLSVVAPAHVKALEALLLGGEGGIVSGAHSLFSQVSATQQPQ